MRKVAGRPASIDTNLNIIQDGAGHVFVDITMTFPDQTALKILLDASTCVDFFELLAETSMMALSSESDGGNIFMIQLPRPERAHDALEMIRGGLGR